ncbi:MAG: RNA methyltransferase [Rhodocyclaceae bacterium]|nr:RNA methyltransferase [Rhodocyclaceae bacterium]
MDKSGGPTRGPETGRDSTASGAVSSGDGATALGRIRVVLSHTSHPGNIGAAARACKTMGLGQLWLVAPQRFPDPEADARASGAGDLLASARVVDTLAEALTGTLAAVALTARPREIAAPQVAPREAAERLLPLTAEGEVALVFGNEQAGLSSEETGLCNLLCQIPTNPAYSSLNLAAAVQILTYEMRLAAAGGSDLRSAGHALEPAGFEEIEALHAHLLATMAALDFYDPDNPRRLEPKLRRLIARAQPLREEVNILRGLLTAVDKMMDEGADERR